MRTTSDHWVVQFHKSDRGEERGKPAGQQGRTWAGEKILRELRGAPGAFGEV